MKRFVTYLYECKNGHKMKNIGFLRVDIRNQAVNMQISIRYQELGNKKGKFYFIVRGKEVYGIQIGDIFMKNGQYNGRFLCSYYEIGGSHFSMEDVIGIGLRFGDSCYVASSWKDEEDSVIALGDFVVYSLEEDSARTVPMDIESTEEEVREETFVKSVIQENTQIYEEKMQAASLQEAVQGQETKADEVEPSLPKEDRRTEDQRNLTILEANQIGANQIETNQIEENQIETNQIEANQTDEIHIAGNESTTSYRKINLNEIYALPGKHWHYSNNSFLMHGFWNYGYLVLKEEMAEGKKSSFLGIPGIFEQPEMVMATFFGFPNFEGIPSEVVDVVIGQEIIISEKEINQQPEIGTFGCWFVNL